MINIPKVDTTINFGCDVRDMFGSINQDFCLRELVQELGKHPNPNGISIALLLDLAKICLRENCAEFLGRFLNPNSGTATGPPHACDFCDVAMAPLDEKMEHKLREHEVEHEYWTIFCDD